MGLVNVSSKCRDQAIEFQLSYHLASLRSLTRIGLNSDQSILFFSL